MIELIHTIANAYRAGKLHRKLIVRIVLLGGIAAIGGIALIVDIVLRNVSIIPILIAAVLGYIFGYFVVSKMRAVEWHEHEEVLTIAGLDIAGAAILIVYVGVRVLADFYFRERFGSAFVISGLTLAFFDSIMLGRLIATLKRIEQLFKDSL
jgi:hypothetical protein